jgi:hypothetical protein
MNLFDLFIIYLACGAPVAVYFYLTNRRRLYSKQLWLKTILNFFFWIPFFFQITRKSRILDKFLKNRFASKNISDEHFEKEIFAVQKNIEKLLPGNDPSVSIYEFREVFERFVGLSKACADNRNGKPNDTDREIFRVSNRNDVEIAARCFHRRNLNRLLFHHTQAEKDFLQLIDEVSRIVSDPEKLCIHAKKVAKILENSKVESALEKMFGDRLQTNKNLSVKDLEKDLWIPETRKQQPASQSSMNLQAISATANSSLKD